MQSTYSFSEIKSLIRSLDLSAISVLEDLIEEEKDCFEVYELNAIRRFLLIQHKQFIHNEVKLEFLLSFN